MKLVFHLKFNSEYYSKYYALKQRTADIFIQASIDIRI